MKLIALVFLGLCATAMAGRSMLADEDLDTTLMNDASDKVARAQQKMASATHSYMNARQNRGLLQKTRDNTRIHDAVDSIRKRTNDLEAIGSRNRVLLQKMRENTKMHDAVDSIRHRTNDLEAIGSRGRVLLQKTRDNTRIHDAVDSIRRRTNDLEAIGSRGRVLLQKTRDNTRIHDAVDSIRKRTNDLEAIGSRNRVLLQKKLDNTKMYDAADSIRHRVQDLEALGSRSRVLLQSHNNGGIDRMAKNSMKLSAAGDAVAQAFSKMAMTTRSRINASELRNSKAAANKAN